MKIADAHLHLFRQGYASRYGQAWANRRELDLYKEFRQVYKIDAGLVIGFEGRPEFRGNNRDIAAWAKNNSWITPLAFIASTSEPRVKTFESLRQQGFAGLAFYASTRADVERLNRWPQSAFRWLNETRQILSINAGPEALAQLQPFISNLERCSILISHLGLPGRFEKPPSRREVKTIMRPILMLAKQSHVGVKLSGFYAISAPPHAYPHSSARPFILEWYEELGPKRLYWGSDFSPALEHVSFPQTIDVLLQFDWPSRVLQAIMHDNLIQVIRGTRSLSANHPQHG